LQQAGFDIAVLPYSLAQVSVAANLSSTSSFSSSWSWSRSTKEMFAPLVICSVFGGTYVSFDLGSALLRFASRFALQHTPKQALLSSAPCTAKLQCTNPSTNQVVTTDLLVVTSTQAQQLLRQALQVRCHCTMRRSYNASYTITDIMCCVQQQQFELLDSVQPTVGSLTTLLQTLCTTHPDMFHVLESRLFDTSAWAIAGDRKAWLRTTQEQLFVGRASWLDDSPIQYGCRPEIRTSGARYHDKLAVFSILP
jgi:hypothetical protein